MNLQPDLKTLIVPTIAGLLCLGLTGCQTPEERAMSQMKRQMRTQMQMLQQMQKDMAEMEKEMEKQMEAMEKQMNELDK